MLPNSPAGVTSPFHSSTGIVELYPRTCPKAKAPENPFESRSASLNSPLQCCSIPLYVPYQPRGMARVCRVGGTAGLAVETSPFHSSTHSTARNQAEIELERTTLAIVAGLSRHLRQMIYLMPQPSFLSSVEDSCSGSKSLSATSCGSSPCAPLCTIAELV